MSGTPALLLFLLPALACVVAEALIVRATVRAAHAHRDPAAGVRLQRTQMEIVWAVLPALALVAVLVLTWSAVRSPSRREPHAPAAPPAELSRR